MKTYTISDLHGYPVDKFKALLDKANFSDTDTLYILGDVIDRNGDGGVSLLRYIMAQPNFGFILGNHEDMLAEKPLGHRRAHRGWQGTRYRVFQKSL